MATHLIAQLPANKLNDMIVDLACKKGQIDCNSTGGKMVQMTVETSTRPIVDLVGYGVNDYYTSNKNAKTKPIGFGVDNSIKETIKNKYTNIVDNLKWYTTNTTKATSGTLGDMKALLITNEISPAEFNRRWENRWSGFSSGSFNRAKQNFY